MTRVVALVRGINVSGHNKLAMAAWRAAAESIGCTQVVTYLQSGNLVCTPPPDATDLAVSLRVALADATGVDVACIVRTADEWSAIVAGNPYPDAASDGRTLHVTVLPYPPGDTYDRVDATAYTPAAFTVGESVLYLYLPGGLGTSKLAVALERAATKRPGTTRNWNTVREIDRLLHA